MKQYKYLYIVSSLMLVTGAALGLVEHLAFDLVYLLGGVGYGIYNLIWVSKAKNLRLRRLCRMNSLAALTFIASAIARMGYLDSYGQGLWIVLLLVGLIFMLYATLITRGIEEK